MSTVLVVDDDEDLREMLVQQLEKTRHHVMAARTGREALLLLARADLHIELVISDIYMPGVDGFEVLTACTTLGVSVIGMSGGDSRGRFDSLRAAGHLGAVHVLQKPFSTDELFAVVDDLLKSEATASAEEVG